MTSDCIGKMFSARVIRVDPYGVYLEFVHGVIIVLIPDVSRERVPDLEKKYATGDQVQVKIVEYVEDRRLFKGTIKEALRND